MSIQQRLSNGLTFNFNYTYSRAEGTVNGFQTAYQSIRALSVNDQPHVMNAFYSYQLPFGKGRMFDPENKVVRSLVSGWTVSGITRAASGVPLGPFTVACSAGSRAPAMRTEIRTIPGMPGSTVTGTTAMSKGQLPIKLPISTLTHSQLRLLTPTVTPRRQVNLGFGNRTSLIRTWPSRGIFRSLRT
jgi:hypothetical protein